MLECCLQSLHCVVRKLKKLHKKIMRILNDWKWKLMKNNYLSTSSTVQFNLIWRFCTPTKWHLSKLIFEEAKKSWFSSITVNKIIMERRREGGEMDWQRDRLKGGWDWRIKTWTDRWRNGREGEREQNKLLIPSSAGGCCGNIKHVNTCDWVPWSKSDWSGTIGLD